MHTVTRTSQALHPNHSTKLSSLCLVPLSLPWNKCDQA